MNITISDRVSLGILRDSFSGKFIANFWIGRLEHSVTVN